MRSDGQDNTVTSSHLLRLPKLKMHLTRANVWGLAVVNTPIGRLTWKMPSKV